MRQASIGIFDSGFGGLTVMNAVQSLLPHEHIVYFGDTARLPYGNKSAETIVKYSLQNAQFLCTKGIKLLIIACHTVCTTAYEELQKQLPVPLIGVMNSSIKSLVQSANTGTCALLGTRRTIDSGVYQQMIQRALPKCEVTAISCPLFVPLVEEGYVDHPISEVIIQEYLKPLKHKTVDGILLGCTHYPLLQASIQKEVGTKTTLIDPAFCCAQEAKDFLESQQLFRTELTRPHHTFYVSDDPEKFRLLGKQFLRHPMEHVFSVHL